ARQPRDSGNGWRSQTASNLGCLRWPRSLRAHIVDSPTDFGRRADTDRISPKSVSALPRFRRLSRRRASSQSPGSPTASQVRVGPALCLLSHCLGGYVDTEFTTHLSVSAAPPVSVAVSTMCATSPPGGARPGLWAEGARYPAWAATSAAPAAAASGS